MPPPPKAVPAGSPLYYALIVAIKYENPGVNHDVEMIQSLLGKVKYPIQQTEVMNNGEITAALVLEKLEHFSQVMKAEDRLYFYITSHGNQQPVIDDDEEKDKKDEYLILDNGSKLIDNDIFKKLRLFGEGTEIVFIVDACSAGTPYAILIPELDWEWTTAFKTEEEKSKKFSILKTQIIYMGASDDKRSAQPDNGGSVFTRKLYETAKSSTSKSFRQLFRNVFKSIEAYQTPVYKEIGRNGVNISYELNDNKISQHFRDEAAFPGQLLV